MCNNCAAGKFLTARNSSSTSSMARTFEGAGQEMMESNFTCDDCGPGQYSVAGSTKCVYCPAGKFGPGVGASACRDCAAGTYSSGGRVLGPEGHQNSTLISNTACRVCPVGKFSLAAATACTTCSAATAHLIECSPRVDVSEHARAFLSSDFAHCSLGLTWPQLLHLRKTSKGRILTGGLGLKIVPGVIKVWLCDRSLTFLL